MKTTAASAKKRHRVSIDAEPGFEAKVRLLSAKWGVKTNVAVQRAVDLARWEKFKWSVAEFFRAGRATLFDHQAWIVSGSISLILAFALAAVLLVCGASQLSHSYEASYRQRLARLEADSVQNTVALNRLLAAGITLKVERSNNSDGYFLVMPGARKAAQPVQSPEGLAVEVILSQELYDVADPLRFDMAEFSAHDAIKNFIGDQTGNLGRLGSLLSDIQGGILLADEIEKAHPDVVAVYLAILDAARVTCGPGRLFDLSNFYLIFTSNLGSADILRARHLNFTQMERHILAQVAATFRPEFLGRIDSKHVFRKLSYDVQLEIAQLNLVLEQRFLREKGYRVSFADDVLPFLIQIGFDKYLGARPLRQAMHKQIRFALAQHSLRSGQNSLVGTLKVTTDRKALYFET